MSRSPVRSARTVLLGGVAAVGLFGASLGTGLAVSTWAASPGAGPAGQPTGGGPVVPTVPVPDRTDGPDDPTGTPDTDRPGNGTYTIYAHAPISSRSTSPAGYVAALEERSDWADGLFLYYPTQLEFGARPEIDALQAAHPEGVPLTISAKNADPAGIAAFRDQLTPQQAALTLWERWQEPADDFTTPAARAEFRADVLSDIELLRPAGVRVGVHEQCWTLNPANPKPWAGEQALLELIPPEVDIVTATCIGWPSATAGEPQMTVFLDFMEEHYPGVDVGFTSMSWAVPTGTPADSPLRAERVAAAREALEFAVSAGVTEFGWFDFRDWDGRDSDVDSDPALLAVLSELSARPLP